MSRRILIVDDQQSILYFLRKTLEAEGFTVETAETAADALVRAREFAPEIVLLDLKLPDRSGMNVLSELRAAHPELRVVMMTAFGDVETSVHAMKLGAFDYVNKPIRLEELLSILAKALESPAAARPRDPESDDLFEGFDEVVPSPSDRMQDIYSLIRRISISDSSTVLIEGESGSGKDVIANLIHANSPRSDHAFLEINCASLPEQLLESELFGHEKGAFTDAVNQKMGLLELAHRGTLFLDEVGEMSTTIQVKLLRVLEKMSFRRVGGVKDIQVDVRILCATNRDLKRSVERGDFREDLYYRLKVVPLHLPPLRERPEDITLLAEHFLRHFSARFGKQFTGLTAEARRRLLEYSWPGNIRELKNMMERVALLEDGTELTEEQLPFVREPDHETDDIVDRIKRAVDDVFPQDGIDFEELITGLERSLIQKAYRAADGNQSQTAKLLKLNRDKLRYRMKSFELL